MSAPDERDYVDPRRFLEAVFDVQEAEGMVASFPRELIPRLPADVAAEMAFEACGRLAVYRRLKTELGRGRPKK
jgi:hypothetical protein